jgi:NADH dehydrogenase
VRVAAGTVVWAAGVRAAPLAQVLARAAGVPVDRAGRIHVRPDLTLAGHPEVLALGDMVAVEAPDGAAAVLPAVAPAAIQEGAHAARLIRGRLEGRPARPFRYVHRGDVATIGRGRAVAEIRGVRVTGRPAWALWLGIHLAQLSGVQNRLLVALRWTVSLTTRRRGARLIRSRTA